jgi:hypothetical protein
MNKVLRCRNPSQVSETADEVDLEPSFIRSWWALTESSVAVTASVASKR